MSNNKLVTGDQMMQLHYNHEQPAQSKKDEKKQDEDAELVQKRFDAGESLRQ